MKKYTFGLMTLLSIIIQFIASSCGTAKAVNTKYAEGIQSNIPGYQCFLIYDETGKAIGGNCVKE
jgi:hypothetical protein